MPCAFILLMYSASDSVKLYENAPAIIDRLKEGKSVRYSRRLNCYYAHMG